MLSRHRGCLPITAPCEERISLRASSAKSRLVGAIPAHPGDRVLPPALHCLEGTGVGVVAAGDGVLQVAILGLDDRVGRVALQRDGHTVHPVACTSWSSSLYRLPFWICG